MRGRQIVRKYLIHSPYKEVVKSMRYNKLQYTARKILKSPEISKGMITQLTRTIKHECEMLCKVVPAPSLFRAKSTNDLLHLNWKPMIEELHRTAPVLIAILEGVAGGSNSKQIIGMVAAILLKSRCKHMCKVQMVISSLLYAGHTSKRVNSIEF